MAPRTLYVSDLDGTLLNAESRVSDESARIINDLIARHDILFTIATARTPATVVPIMSGIHATLPFIVIGGAAWWNPVEHDYSHLNIVHMAAVRAIHEVMARHGLCPFIYCRRGSDLHTFHYGPMSAQETTFVAQRQGLRYKRFILDDPHYLDHADQVLLIFSMNRYDVLEGVRRDVLNAGIDCEVMLYPDIVDPCNGYLEIFAPGCSKATAITRMARHVGADRVVVFGDNGNDIPMMRAATVSVAMANAFDPVKAIATTVTGPNTQDSVAHWIARDVED